MGGGASGNLAHPVGAGAQHKISLVAAAGHDRARVGASSVRRGHHPTPSFGQGSCATSSSGDPQRAGTGLVSLVRRPSWRWTGHGAEIVDPPPRSTTTTSMLVCGQARTAAFQTVVCSRFRQLACWRGPRSTSSSAIDDIYGTRRRTGAALSTSGQNRRAEEE